MVISSSVKVTEENQTDALNFVVEVHVGAKEKMRKQVDEFLLYLLRIHHCPYHHEFP